MTALDTDPYYNVGDPWWDQIGKRGLFVTKCRDQFTHFFVFIRFTSYIMAIDGNTLSNHRYFSRIHFTHQFFVEFYEVGYLLLLCIEKISV
jgi:hypothetical protein